MPYSGIDDLPERIRTEYSAKGQRAFLAAFNSAFDGTCAKRKDREGCAFAVATAAAQRAEKGSMSKAIEFLKSFIGVLEYADADNQPVDVVTDVWTGEPTIPITVNIAKAGRIVKADDELQVLYLPVLVPDIEDSQGDIVDKAEIQKAAHRFSREYAAGEAELGLDHEMTLDREQAHIVESWLEKQNTDYGTDRIPEGSWMIGIHIPDIDIWKSAKAGERTGASIEGTGIREAIE